MASHPYSHYPALGAHQRPAIRQALPGDLSAVSRILEDAARWLHDRGIDQWPPGLPSLSSDRIRAQIARGETYLVVSDRGDPIATIAVAADGDPDYWSAAELAEPAVYVSKAAVVRSRGGEGLGGLILRWVVDQAAVRGARWVRLDISKTNPALQAYYRARGWAYLRLADAPHRRGGVLFQRAATLDPEARAALIRAARARTWPYPARAAVTRSSPTSITW